MIPKNHKQFIKPTAEKLGCSEVMVQDIVEFYYSNLRKSLSLMKAPAIQIENLGTFSVKSNKLPALIQKHKAHLASLDKPKTFFKMALRKEVELRLYRVELLKQMIDKERQRKAEFISNKKNGIKKDI